MYGLVFPHTKQWKDILDTTVEAQWITMDSRGTKITAKSVSQHCVFNSHYVLDLLMLAIDMLIEILICYDII